MRPRLSTFGWLAFFLAVLLLVWTGRPQGQRSRGVDYTSDDAVEEEVEMGELGAMVPTNVLYVDPASSGAARRAFRKRLQASGKGSGGNKRDLYEDAIDRIGANGILAEMEGLWPKCHSEAHALGRVIEDRVEDIGTGLRICADGCYSGCMHGILMEAFAVARDADDPEGHVDVGQVTKLMDDLCGGNDVMTASYSPGDCAHGVGHALMVLVDEDVPQAVELCQNFDNDPMDYYCATGAYMEYVTEHDPRDAKDGESLFYPCDRYDYPSACARYKAVHVVRRHYGKKGTTEDLLEECRKLSGTYRLGCIHGLGNGHMGRLLKGKTTLSELCLSGTTEEEQVVCIEGAMERMAKYHKPRARQICEELAGRPREICLTAVDHGMYDMEKDLSLYLRE